jgi:hypothetical protein
MSKTIDIPGGQAVLRERFEMKVRQRRMVEIAAMPIGGILTRLPKDKLDEAMKIADEDVSVGGRQLGQLIDALPISRKEAESLYELQDATILSLLISWTLPEPIPTLDTIQDIDDDVYQALSDATATLGAALARGGTGVDFSPSPDQSRPTGPSRPSDGVLRGAKSKSTGTRRSTGKSIAIESSTPA